MSKPTPGAKAVGEIKKMDALLSGFKERDARQREKFEIAGDSEFWFCAIFKTRDQKEAFLKAIGVFEDADKYVDGEQLASLLKIKIPPAELIEKPGRADKVVTGHFDPI